jgi:TetR/AcrR family transcriptional repressor of bet genes
MDATITSISKHGISGTTMTTVTQIAGLSLGLVNFHFKTKEALLEETLRHLAEEHRAQWRKSVGASGLAPEAQLLAIVQAQFHPHICSRKKLAVWFAFFGEAAYRSSYRKIVTGIDRERWEVSTGLCRQIAEDGGYGSVDPNAVAKSLEGLFDGFWLNMLMYPGEFTRLDALQQIHDFLAITFPRHFGRQPGASGD